MPTVVPPDRQGSPTTLPDNNPTKPTPDRPAPAQDQRRESGPLSPNQGGVTEDGGVAPDPDNVGDGEAGA